MEIIRTAFAAIITALLYTLLRQIKPEIASLILIGGVSVIVIMLAETLTDFSGDAAGMLSLAGIEKENITALLKALGICISAQFAANICNDNSCSSLAAAVELAGKVGALSVAMPMLKAVANLAIGLLNV
ncbi:MAG: stage III sporulation AC/AD family protein [Clostridia bacterium]|nr:stage III sporulation AC/AD family protein [Clostridia bacterium]